VQAVAEIYPDTLCCGIREVVIVGNGEVGQGLGHWKKSFDSSIRNLGGVYQSQAKYDAKGST